jgi:HD superfamily phosphohydrolase
MEFRGMEAVVVDLLRTPELQRLRKIRQLGLAHLVFPGAEHSRLVHSLGASFLAIRFGRHIKEKASQFFIPALCPDEAAIRDLGLAALCHDLGHGPLSHAWEREIVGERFNHQAWGVSLGLKFPAETLERLKWHELVGHSFLLWKDGYLHRLLEQHEEGLSLRISELLLGNYYISYLPRILSSDIDVDRADFLRRDTHQTGVAYGRYDLDWLISTCTLGKKSNGLQEDWVIGFDSRKAIRVVEQFFTARRALYETVYHHRTVRSAEGMMALFLRRLRAVITEGVKIEVADFMQPILEMMKGKALEPGELIRLDDFTLSVLVDQIAQSSISDDTVRDLATRIRSRDLFKQVPVSADVLNHYLRSDHSKEKLYEVVKPYAPGLSEYYIVVDETKFKMLSSEDREKVCLIDEHGKATYANEHILFDLYRHGEEDGLRIFTLREAVDEVKKCIESA